MKTRTARRVTARYNWDRLKVSFWFTPVIMSLAAIVLAWGVYWVDSQIPNEMLDTSRFILAGTPGELRSILISMAGTILATAGVVFTLLTLPLSTVAAQYGSRLLRVFLGDRTTQLVLGMFVATFVYCVSAALSIPPEEVEPEGPQLTATVGLLLMLGTFSSLILLVHHISTMLQAPNIAAAAGAELRNVVLAEIPEMVNRDAGSQTSQEAAGILRRPDGYPVLVKETGYIELIDPEPVLALARESNLVIHLLRKPGRFVRRGEVIALVWLAEPHQEQPGLHSIGEPLAEQIRNAFRIGNTRTPTQDVTYAVNQLVEMAVRAMSPAINDPFTAMTCLDYIGENLALFIRQGEKGAHYYDLNGRLRLVLEPVTFEELLSTAFDMLRHASCDNASVMQHMLETIDVIGKETKSPEARQLLRRHVSLILAESQTGHLIEVDRQLIQHRSEDLMMKLLDT
jgi:uncharacterized membrane protein